MSLASQLKEQNETLVGVKDGVESLNASFIKFFNLDEQRKTRERLQDKERQQDSKNSRNSLFGMFGVGGAKKASSKKDDKEFKGLLGGAGGQLTQAILGTRLLTMMGGRGGKGGIFTSVAKGAVGLGLFAFADAIASEVDKLNPDSPELGDLSYRIAKSGGLGYLLFGRKGAIVGGILGAFDTDENRELIRKSLENVNVDPKMAKDFVGGLATSFLKSVESVTSSAPALAEAIKQGDTEEIKNQFSAISGDLLNIAGFAALLRPIKSLKLAGSAIKNTALFGKNLIFGKGAPKGAGADLSGAAGRQGMFSKMSDAVGRRAGAFMEKKPLQSAVTGTRNALVAGSMNLGVATNGKSGEALTKILNNKKFQKVLGALNKIPGGRYIATIPAMATVLTRTDLSQEEKKREFVKLFGGMGGAVLGAAVGGLLTAPGGPLAALGVLGGGILGGFGGEYIAGLLYDYIMGDNKSTPTIPSEAVSSQGVQGLGDLGGALSTPDLIPDRVKASVQKPIPQQGMRVAEASMMRDQTATNIFRAGDTVAIDNSSRSNSSHLLGTTSSSVDAQDPTFRTRNT